MQFYLMALAVFAIDQFSKYYVTQHFRLGEDLPLIENIFHLTYILNSGAAFGLLEGNRWLFIAIAFLVLGYGLIMRRELLSGDAFLRYGSALFSGGALGNVLDRLRCGFVIDFLDFRIWPVFNIADVAICLGVGAILWSICRREYLEKQ